MSCLCSENPEMEKKGSVKHVVGIPPTLQSWKDSDLYLELLQDCWHYQDVTWFDLYLINLPLSPSVSLFLLYTPTFLCLNCLMLRDISLSFFLSLLCSVRDKDFVAHSLLESQLSLAYWTWKKRIYDTSCQTVTSVVNLFGFNDTQIFPALQKH